MSDYGLEIRDSEGVIIMDSSTFTVRQVAKRFISSADLRLKVGQTAWTKAVQFPWAEAKYGMFISVTQVNLAPLPRNPNALELAGVRETNKGSLRVVDETSLDRWILDSPRLPVAVAYDGYITLAPAVYQFNADVWLSLYVVV
jgi:hypothetical protein